MDARELVHLKGVVSRSRASAEALVAATGAPLEVYESLADVAVDASVDFAIVVTPPNARAEVIAPLAAAGKHILLEKPVGRTAAEARAVVALCAEADVQLGVVFQHRMRAASLAARDLVASGRLGALGVAEMRVPWWRDQGYYDEPGRGTYARDGGGVLISQAIHTIDLALSLTGPVKAVRAMAHTTMFHDMEAEDYVTAALRFANGAVGSMVASTASYPGGAESITLHFETASVHLEAGTLTVSWRDGRVETYGAQAETGGGADPMAFTHAWHQEIITDFAKAIRAERAPMVTGAQALVAHDFIDAVTAAAQTGSEVELT